MGKLTVMLIKNAQPGSYPDNFGLYLWVKESGARSWLFRYTSPTQGKRRWMGLGPWPYLSLANAREEVVHLCKLVRKGTDPLEHRREKIQVKKVKKSQEIWTFEKCAANVHEMLRPSWKNEKHALQWITTLEQYVFPKTKNRPVGSLGVADFMPIFKSIWITKHETASRVLQRADAVMRWAVAHGYAQSNPCAAVAELLPKVARIKRHQPSMPWREIPDFLSTAAEERTTAVVRLALEFLILTAARSGEIRGAVWGEVDFNKAIWTIPGKRMKSKREHRVPLAHRCLVILREIMSLQPELDQLIFITERGKALSDTTLTMLMRRKGLVYVPHGFRSSFRDWASENGYSRDLAERALAHVVTGQVEAAYHRTDLLEQRRPMMEAWANFCEIHPKENGF